MNRLVEEFADQRRHGRREYADMRHGGTRDLGLTPYRLKLLKHSRCACGERATSVSSHGAFRCDLCRTINDQRRRARLLFQGY